MTALQLAGLVAVLVFLWLVSPWLSAAALTLALVAIPEVRR